MRIIVVSIMGTVRKNKIGGWFDGHWHARDGKQSHKETVKHSLELTNIAGGTGLIAIGNTDPPLTTEERCVEYLALANDVEVHMRFYVLPCLTSDTEQVKRMVDASRRVPGIAGLKMFWDDSTGNLGIKNKDDQYKVIETLVQEGYNGVLVGHNENCKVSFNDRFDRVHPKTWSTICRPEISEISSFAAAVEMLTEQGFHGKYHVAHVSTLPVVDFIANYQGPLRLSCGATPHHLFLNDHYLQKSDGVWYKCNPPLRSPQTQNGLQNRLIDGRIPIIESDHAPHTEEDKMKDLPASGIISAPIWPYMICHLKELGMETERIRAATFGNVVRLFGLENRIQCEEREVQWGILDQMRAAYPHDPFKMIF